MSGITTHVLDTSAGHPAADVSVTLERRDGEEGWREVACTRTDADGRTGGLLDPDAGPSPGEYRLRFEVGEYYRARDTESFYPYVEVVFQIVDASQHYHVPLLLSPFGYSTYRGS